MESLDLTKTEVNSLRKAETNVLKRLLGLTVQCKTTELIRGLRIEPTHIYLKRMKLSFLARLSNNHLTNEMLQALVFDKDALLQHNMLKS